MGARDVGNVEAFHDSRNSPELKGIRQRDEIFLRVDGARKRLARKASHRLRRSLEIVEKIAQLGRSFEIKFLRRGPHICLNLLDHLSGRAVEKFTGFIDPAKIVRLGDLSDAGSGAVFMM